MSTCKTSNYMDTVSLRVHSLCDKYSYPNSADVIRFLQLNMDGVADNCAISSSTERTPPIGSESDGISNQDELSPRSDTRSPDVHLVNGNECSDTVPTYRSTSSAQEKEGYRRRSTSMAEVRDHAYGRLRAELTKAQEELKLKDEECEKLTHVRDQMGEELEELTASLFEEANKMVQDANIKRMQAEKLHKDDQDSIQVLEAEVKALKELVITSTPSVPNKHLHPQLAENIKENKGDKSPKLKSFSKGHKRSTSHHDVSKDINLVCENNIAPKETSEKQETISRELDLLVLQEFKGWKANGEIKHEDPFIARILFEDVKPCLNFPDKELSEKVLKNVENNTLTIEAIPSTNQVVRKCSVTKRQNVVCKHRIKFGDTEPWYDVSQIVRNRIAAVCDFFTYIRYIKQGLVKTDDVDMYWHITELRKGMAIARFGLS